MKRFVPLAAAMAILGGFLTAPLSACAEDLKIGVFSMERILRDSRSAAEASERLSRESEQDQAEIEELTKRLKHRLAKFEKNHQTMPEHERIAERREIAEMERDIARRNREKIDEMNQRRNEEVLLLQAHIGRVVRDLARREKYDLILYECFYASDKVDITDIVMEEVDKFVTAK